MDMALTVAAFCSFALIIGCLVGFKERRLAAPYVDLSAEEIALIVPIPEKLLDGANYDLWQEYKPLLDERASSIAHDYIVKPLHE